MNQLFVSVIVPVYNGSDHLKSCLAALQSQTYPKENYEIIVVDNASEENIQCVVNQFTGVKLAYESQPGSYAARNKGISYSKGEILAFTDADCIPDANWIERGVMNVSQNPDCGLIAGKIEVVVQNPDEPSVIEFFDSVTAFPQKNFVKLDKFGATANIFTTKKVIQEVGAFDASLKSNGDREWGNRVYRHGYSLIYDDELCVGHSARHTFSQIRKKYARLIGGQHDLNIKQGDYSILMFARDIIRDIKTLKMILYVLVFKTETQTISIESKKLRMLDKLKISGLIVVISCLQAFERSRLYFMRTSSERG